MPSHSSEEKLPLSYNITKKGTQWDPDTCSFNVTQSTAGLYFVALSVGLISMHQLIIYCTSQGEGSVEKQEHSI